MASSEEGVGEDLSGKFPVVLHQALVWRDMDAFSHVNNAVYFRYFEDARIDYFRRIGVMEHMEACRIGPILASTRCDFLAPLTFPDTLQIGARIEQMAEKRFVMAYQVYSERLKKTAAQGEGMIVYYDYQAGASCPVPGHIVERIERLEAPFHAPCSG